MTTLLDLTEQLVEIESESHNEGAIADFVVSYLAPFGHLEVTRVNHNVVAKTAGDDDTRIVIGGHLDTVPRHPGQVTRREGDLLYGLGTADMKSSLAIMLELATKVELPIVPVTYVFYACEEVGRAHSGLNDLFAVPNLVRGRVALLLEPTAGGVEAGCQGTLRIEASFGGVRAHTARPFRGVNAIHRMAEALASVSGIQPDPVVIDGLTYAQQLQVVSVTGGVAGNVVPDAASFAVNYRFAPSTSLDEAERWVRSLIEPFIDGDQGDVVTLQDGAGGAMPGLTDPFIAKLVDMASGEPTAKVGWTDCATFYERGIPACNFGPGDPLLAHHPDEHVNTKTLEAAYGVLHCLLSEAAR